MESKAVGFVPLLKAYGFGLRIPQLFTGEQKEATPHGVASFYFIQERQSNALTFTLLQRNFLHPHHGLIG